MNCPKCGTILKDKHIKEKKCWSCNTELIWNCKNCTTANLLNTNVCEYCKCWVCKKCDHTNNSEDKICKKCEPIKKVTILSDIQCPQCSVTLRQIDYDNDICWSCGLSPIKGFFEKKEKVETVVREVMKEEQKKEIKKTNNNVVITNIDIPYWRLVSIMIKSMLASIPAFIIFWIVFSIFAFLFLNASIATLFYWLFNQY